MSGAAPRLGYSLSPFLLGLLAECQLKALLATWGTFGGQNQNASARYHRLLRLLGGVKSHGAWVGSAVHSVIVYLLETYRATGSFPDLDEAIKRLETVMRTTIENSRLLALGLRTLIRHERLLEKAMELNELHQGLSGQERLPVILQTLSLCTLPTETEEEILKRALVEDGVSSPLFEQVLEAWLERNKRPRNLSPFEQMIRGGRSTVLDLHLFNSSLPEHSEKFLEEQIQRAARNLGNFYSTEMPGRIEHACQGDVKNILIIDQETAPKYPRSIQLADFTLTQAFKLLVKNSSGEFTQFDWRTLPAGFLKEHDSGLDAEIKAGMAALYLLHVHRVEPDHFRMVRVELDVPRVIEERVVGFEKLYDWIGERVSNVRPHASGGSGDGVPNLHTAVPTSDPGVCDRCQYAALCPAVLDGRTLRSQEKLYSLWGYNEGVPND